MNKTRYERQLCLHEVGEEGQKKLSDAKVLVVGAGGLGSPALQYLVGAGIGKVGIVEYDTISESNLQRQILYRESQVGLSKAQCAGQSLKELNRACVIETYPTYLNQINAPEIIKFYDLVIDATDNAPTRYLIDITCRELSKPWIYGGVEGWSGQLSVFGYSATPIYYTDVFGSYDSSFMHLTMPDNSQRNTSKGIPVIAPLPGVIGSLQAIEAIKIILNRRGVLHNKLLLFDGLNSTFRLIEY